MLHGTILVVHICRQVANECSLHDLACFASTWKVLSSCQIIYNIVLKCDYVNVAFVNEVIFL